MANQVVTLKIENLDRVPIVFDIHFSKIKGKAPLVVFCHGFKGFKDWGSFNYIANCFAKAEITFLKFNFSGNGTTPDFLMDFADLEAFGNNNFNQELGDLECILNWVESNFEKSTGLNYSSIVLMGHSRGGGIAILKAAKDKRINQLITWAAVSDFENMLIGYDKLKWEQDGVVYIKNTRTKQNMPLNFQLYKDLNENRETLNIKHAAQNILVPWLILHAKDDSVVLLGDAKKLNQANKFSNLEVVSGGAHTFGAGHPFDEKSVSEYLLEALNKSISFIKLNSNDE